MRISVLIGTRNRAAPLLRCLESVRAQRLRAHEVVVLDDASDEVDVARVLADAGVSGVRVIRTQSPVGVGAGRNRLYAAASGDIFFVLDDDAYFDGPDSLERVAEIFRDQPRTGIVATRIVDHRSSQPAILAPFSRRARRRTPGITERSGLASYFLGGGHAIRRSVFQATGGYHDSFVFGEEELDLSYRAIEAGFDVYYASDVLIQHHPMPSVLRSPTQRRSELYFHMQNRALIAKKYLPARFALPYLAIWLGRYAGSAVSIARMADFLKGLAGVAKVILQEPRTPLSDATLGYLRRNHGRLWF